MFIRGLCLHFLNAPVGAFSEQVSRDALKEERTPLLDLDDVEQFESELAACFDAPPPPPLNIRVSVRCVLSPFLFA